MTDSTPIRTALSEAYLGDTKNFHSMFSAPQTFDLRLQNILAGFSQQSDAATADDLAMAGNLRAIAKAMANLSQPDRIQFISDLKSRYFRDSISPSRGPLSAQLNIVSNSGFGLAVWINSADGKTSVGPSPAIYHPTFGAASIDQYINRPYVIPSIYETTDLLSQPSLFSLLTLPALIGPAVTYEEKKLFAQAYLDPRLGTLDIRMDDEFNVTSYFGGSGSPRGVHLVEMVPDAYGDFDVLHQINLSFKNTSLSEAISTFRIHISPSTGQYIGDISSATGRTFSIPFILAASASLSLKYMLRLKRVAGVVTAGMAQLKED